MKNVIIITYIIAVTIQLIYYLLFFSRFAFYNKRKKNKSLPVLPTTTNTSFSKKEPTTHHYLPVSVIICAKNEADNLRRFLPKILAQDYPFFELLIVNDASEDDTAAVLAAFQQKNNQLKVINILIDEKKDMYGKKFALTKGIEASSHDILLLTDADCVPSSKNWITQMVQHLGDKDIKIVLGYSPYLTVANRSLNAMIQYETLWTATQYLSFALLKMPYMGVGRNLAYHKSVFMDNHGFQSHKKVLSGDDDLFINEVAKANNTRIEIAKNAFCYSLAPTTWRAWYHQKQRHLSAGTHYRAKFQILLGVLALSHFAFYGTLIAALLLHYCYITIITFFILRLTVQVVIFQKILQKLDSPLPLWWLPIADFLSLFYYIILFPTTLLNKNIQWK